MGSNTEFISQIFAPTISSPFDSRDLMKGWLICIVLCPNIVKITMCGFVTIPSHTIDGSSCIKLMNTRRDFKLHFLSFAFLLHTVWKSLFAAI